MVSEGVGVWMWGKGVNEGLEGGRGEGGGGLVWLASVTHSHATIT